ncbi:MAG: ATP-dependent helicase, partial [Erysipelotrichaceae bacterium]|nr:ATP-dependent helicase [Erysipelotrichaceae bacterium]
VRHAREMDKVLNNMGISAKAYVSGSDTEKVMEDFRNKKIRFLCSCQMISEGWDYPELGILVMARPTLSKVLYLQQLGRGLRKTDKKKNVFVIDVVDSYGSMVKPFTIHSIFHNPCYVPFGDPRVQYKVGDMITVDGLVEKVKRIVEVDVESFEDKYGDYLSQEQLAQEYFVSTGTITSWIRKGKIKPTVTFKFGSKEIPMFSPEDKDKYRKELDIAVHNDETIRDDFFRFLEERDYSLSYKMPFLLGFLKHMDQNGEANIGKILDYYIDFYQDRIDKGLVVDRRTCPYNIETLKDRTFIKRNMLTNPFEKFERKRFMYYSKDLNMIAMNHALFRKLTDEDYKRIEKQMNDDLKDYYDKLENI